MAHPVAGPSLTCPCGSMSLVLKWLGDHSAELECHECWGVHRVGVDACFKNFRPGGNARRDLREDMLKDDGPATFGEDG